MFVKPGPPYEALAAQHRRRFVEAEAARDAARGTCAWKVKGRTSSRRRCMPRVVIGAAVLHKSSAARGFGDARARAVIDDARAASAANDARFAGPSPTCARA